MSNQTRKIDLCKEDLDIIKDKINNIEQNIKEIKQINKDFCKKFEENMKIKQQIDKDLEISINGIKQRSWFSFFNYV